MIGWLVDERGIEPHVKLMDKVSERHGREPSPAATSAFDPQGNLYVCPAGKELTEICIAHSPSHATE